MTTNVKDEQVKMVAGLVKLLPMSVIEISADRQLNADRFLNQDGYVVVRGLLPQDAVQGMASALEKGADRQIAGWIESGLIDRDFAEVPWQQRLHAAAEAAGSSTERPEVLRSWRHRIVSPELFALQTQPALVEALQTIAGPEVYGHEAFNGRPKLPGSEMQVVPWHQDHGYYGEDDRKDLVLTTWIPMVPVDHANGCMQVIAGSHLNGPLKHEKGSNAAAFLEIPSGVDETNVETCEMEPGDVLIMHPMVLHRSTPNVSDVIRWSVDLRFVCGQSARRDHLPWVIRSQDRQPWDLAQWYEWQYDMLRGNR